jgi:predicted DNA-binding protein
MPKKTSEKVAGKRADQYMLRFSEGMRDRLAKLAGANGRSMNAEILEAIEKHLEGTDRVTQIWEFVEKHRENIQAISELWQGLDNLKYEVRPLIDEREYAAMIRADREHKARVASLPPISAEQAAVIRRLIQETGADEARLLKLLGVPTIEEIKDFERGVSILEQRAAMIRADRESP